MLMSDEGRSDTGGQQMNGIDMTCEEEGRELAA
jgi:hypothetical protein